jgi:hypothetical protein
MGLTTPHCKNVTYYEMFQSTYDLDWFLAQPEQWEKDMRFELGML